MVARSHDVVAMCLSWLFNFLYERVVLVLLMWQWAEVYLLPYLVHTGCAEDGTLFQGCRQPIL